VNGGVVRDTWFCKPGVRGIAGYDAQQVDDLLSRVAAELDTGGSARPLIQNAAFRKRKYGRRYDIDAVDRFLDRFLLPVGHVEPDGVVDDPWGDFPVARSGEGDAEESFYPRCENAWRDFGQVPGTHLWFGKAARRLTELRTAGQHTLASVRGKARPDFSAAWRSFTSQPASAAEADFSIAELLDRVKSSTWPDFSAGGRSFTLQPAFAAESASPAIAELLTRAEAGHYAEETHIPNTLNRHVRRLADETGTPILYTFGHNYNCRACACILFPDLRWLRFLVRGTQQANAIMTAVDQAGNRVARYRSIDKSGGQVKLWSRSSVEIIVHPGRKLTDELALALALSADWLSSYFIVPSQGG
jgi:hypothetical protein